MKTRLLRLPGQSNDEHVRILQDTWTDVLVWPLIFCILAGVEWIQWWDSTPPSPWVPSVLAVLSMCYAYWKYRTLRPEIQAYKLGRDGERLVGEMLDQLRVKGYRVFHDVVGEGFNIDHVIVGPAGVFTIETKTRSKPSQGNSRVIYDGKTVRIGNGVPTDAPLNQARAQARWLTDFINDGCSRKFGVRPVLVFPEWYVEQIGAWRESGLWVLNPKGLDDFLDHESQILTNQQVDFVASILTRHCRQLAA
ncbi:MAG: NERD domain-containing protein [Nitrospira sp.]|nr:NERD domain-containing protein [Nitrospira sp.]